MSLTLIILYVMLVLNIVSQLRKAKIQLITYNEGIVFYLSIKHIEAIQNILFRQDVPRVT